MIACSNLTFSYTIPRCDYVTLLPGHQFYWGGGVTIGSGHLRTANGGTESAGGIILGLLVSYGQAHGCGSV